VSDVAVRVEGLGKRYRLGARQQPYYSLRDSLSDALRVPLKAANRMLHPGARGISKRPDFWALRDVSFEMKRGDSLGIIGRNGAGKSTLLKLLSEVTEPTEGRITVRGRVASLLEVGTGFHPELSGRENVFLNGAILGMTRAEIARKFDEIVAFAEVEKFIDTQVKHYSSGMYLRLAFAVAAHLEPEILVIDEVLAVGDAAFQQKCMGKMGEAAGEGRTVLYVSHNMGAIQSLCSSALWLDFGRIGANGKASDVVSKYLSDVFDSSQASGRVSRSTDPLLITGAGLTDVNGLPARDYSPGDGLRIEIRFFAPRRFEKPGFWIDIESPHGPVVSAHMLIDGHYPQYIEGEGTVACTFPSLPLVPQTYRVRMGVHPEDSVAPIVAPIDVGYVNVVGCMRDLGFHGVRADMVIAGCSPFVVPYQWRLPDGSHAAVGGFGILQGRLVDRSGTLPATSNIGLHTNGSP